MTDESNARRWGLVYLTAALALWQLMLCFDLIGLESGMYESVVVWDQHAEMYELFGFWGAVSLLPVLWVLFLVLEFLSSRLKLQKVVVVLLLVLACLAFWGLAVWFMFSLPAILGCVFGFLAWRTARLPLERGRIVALYPSGIDSFVEKNTWVKVAMLAAIIAIISGVFGILIFGVSY